MDNPKRKKEKRFRGEITFFWTRSSERKIKFTENNSSHFYKSMRAETPVKTKKSLVL